MAVQFLLGGLFSAYAIFYSRSATLTSTAIFFALLVVLLVANEFLRDRLSSLRLLVSLYALVCFAFFTFFLPVMTGLMNAAIFLVGAGLSAVVTFRVVQLIYQQPGTLETRGGRGDGSGLRVDRAAGRVLFPELDSSRAALDEVRRDVS